jgi:hypothetical protein
MEPNVSLFYRPNANFKLGWGYASLKSTYFQIATEGSQVDDVGDNHRVQVAGWFFF